MTRNYSIFVDGEFVHFDHKDMIHQLNKNISLEIIVESANHLPSS